ncbi:hypothetical protein BN194_19520 [Lacticaseibacillus paracasei]|nr:hypothetical protein LCALC10_1721 [Lacticaseibacillus paracasei]EPD07627.1 hypothetical protein Lpp78_01784 [Lacticaseibacillus paracasei subsp. paracasei CNCM I-2877]CCK22899.1 hypothetical protein BN194_19520 [Lacticaseibacillus paracasei]
MSKMHEKQNKQGISLLVELMRSQYLRVGIAFFSHTHGLIK